ncbi:MAG: demethoxyubiquinone hydroxylase family protein [Formosimonas sp.]|jgi:ubiquinone biosynthesis monooxygenase Coq7
MRYQVSRARLSTATKILKVNHAGEHGAVQIYRAQMLVARYWMPSLMAQLQHFRGDEERHREIFWQAIVRRHGVKCRSYWLCAVGGWFLGFVSALLGVRGVMACTYAVESVVVAHLHEQLAFLKSQCDDDAFETVQAILSDEENHRDFGASLGQSTLYAPLRWLIGGFTELVILWECDEAGE